MKKILILGLVCLSSLSAWAGQTLIQNGKGSIKILTRPDLANGNTLLIEGPAAKTLFNKLSNDLIESVDAGERVNGKRLVWKSGENIYCSLELANTPKGKNEYTCVIEVEDSAKGKIVGPGVG